MKLDDKVSSYYSLISLLKCCGISLRCSCSYTSIHCRVISSQSAVADLQSTFFELINCVPLSPQSLSTIEHRPKALVWDMFVFIWRVTDFRNYAPACCNHARSFWERRYTAGRQWHRPCWDFELFLWTIRHNHNTFVAMSRLRKPWIPQ